MTRLGKPLRKSAPFSNCLSRVRLDTYGVPDQNGLCAAYTAVLAALRSARSCHSPQGLNLWWLNSVKKTGDGNHGEGDESQGYYRLGTMPVSGKRGSPSQRFRVVIRIPFSVGVDGDSLLPAMIPTSTWVCSYNTHGVPQMIHALLM